MGGAAVLVVQVVGVLPDVEGEDGLQASDDGVGGAGLLGDGERAVRRRRKPYPAGAEEPGALGDELVLECVQATPLLHDLLRQGGFRAGPGNTAGRQGLGPGLRKRQALLALRQARGPGGRPELREIQVVVQYLPCVVENGAGRLADNLGQDRFFAPPGMTERLEFRPDDQLVQVIDIALQMLAVMESYRPCADHRLQRILLIRKFNQCKHIVLAQLVLRFISDTFVVEIYDRNPCIIRGKS